MSTKLWIPLKRTGVLALWFIATLGCGASKPQTDSSQGEHQPSPMEEQSEKVVQTLGDEAQGAPPMVTESATELPEDMTHVKVQFEALCMACHQHRGGPNMQAPPIFPVVDHYRRAYSDEHEMIEAMVQYVKNPTVEASLMPGARRKFGLMPALPLPDEQLRQLITHMVYGELKEPKWYRQHYEQEHKRGYGK